MDTDGPPHHLGDDVLFVLTGTLPEEVLIEKCFRGAL